MRLPGAVALAIAISAGGVYGQSAYPENPPMAAAAADGPIRIDGRLDEEAWRRAKPYELATAREGWINRHPELRAVYEHNGIAPGRVRLLLDDDYLYVGAEFRDDDLVAEGGEDQLLHCNLGDVLEIFLKPEAANHYWEIHLAPTNRRAVLFYPGRGHHLLPSVLPKKSPLPGLKSAVALDGTLNRSDDVDRGWTAEIAIPLVELARRGVPLEEGRRWRILAGRYNYSVHTPVKELSSYPALRFFDFHAHEEYAVLDIFDRAPDRERGRK